MKVTTTALDGLLLLAPRVFGDSRGAFFESYHRVRFHEAGITADFVQDNHSFSTRGVLRGLHYQLEQPQGKLVRAATGSIFDVAVDVRRASPTFAQWFGTELSDVNHHMLWIPAGFAHGYFTLSDTALVLYKADSYYAPAAERCIRWDAPEIGVAWPLSGMDPVLSERDRRGTEWHAGDFFT